MSPPEIQGIAHSVNMLMGGIVVIFTPQIFLYSSSEAMFIFSCVIGAVGLVFAVLNHLVIIETAGKTTLQIRQQLYGKFATFSTQGTPNLPYDSGSPSKSSSATISKVLIIEKMSCNRIV